MVKIGEQAAEMWVENLLSFGLKTTAFELDNLHITGAVKVRHHNLSIVDAIILVIGKTRKAQILTTDTPLSKVDGFLVSKLSF